MRAVYDLVDLPPIIAASRELAFADQTLGQYLPDTLVEDVDYRLGSVNLVHQTVPARGLDTPAITIARPGVAEVRGGLPAFTPIDLMTESDLQKARRQAGLPVELQASAQAAANRTTATILNTMETLRGQALFTLGISVAVRGTAPQVVDFNPSGSNKFVAATAWTSAAAPVLTNLIAWHDAYVASAGGPAGRILMSTQAMRLATKSTEVVNAITGSAAGRSQVTLAELNGLLAANGLPPVETYDRSLRNLDGTVVRVAPSNRIAFLPPAGVPAGQTQYGPTEEAAELINARVLAPGQGPGIAVVTLVNDNPVQKAVKSAAIGLPVIGPDGARSIVVASVF